MLLAPWWHGKLTRNASGFYPVAWCGGGMVTRRGWAEWESGQLRRDGFIGFESGCNKRDINIIRTLVHF